MTEPPPLTSATTAALRALADRPATAYEVVCRTGITGGTVSRALDRAVRDGWATYTEASSSSWGRRRRYAITQAGRDQIARHDQT